MENITQIPQIPVTPDPINPSVPQIPPIGSNQTKNSHSGILYIIIGVLLLGMGFLGYEVYSLKKSPSTVAETVPNTVGSTSSSPVPTQITDPTANWITYNADKIFGFSIRYPQTYNLSDNSARTVAIYLYPTGYNSLSEIQKQSAPSISIQETALSSNLQD